MARSEVTIETPGVTVRLVSDELGTVDLTALALAAYRATPWPEPALGSGTMGFWTERRDDQHDDG